MRSLIIFFAAITDHDVPIRYIFSHNGEELDVNVDFVGIGLKPGEYIRNLRRANER